jgi:hypothetical protein
VGVRTRLERHPSGNHRRGVEQIPALPHSILALPSRNPRIPSGGGPAPPHTFHSHELLKSTQVKVHNSTVTSKGHVRTWQERDDAVRAAWAAPGVGNVENLLYLQ